jgi:hypothetical protein
MPAAEEISIEVVWQLLRIAVQSGNDATVLHVCGLPAAQEMTKG